MLTLPKPKRTLAFAIEGEAGEYSIPYPGGLGLNYAKRLRELSGIQDPGELAARFMDILVDVLNEYAPGAADRMSADGLGVLLQAWSENQGDGLGE